MNFGEFVKSLRNENKLSHRALAEKSGISSFQLSRIETGHRNPTPNTLKAIAPSLGVTYQVLMQKAGFIEEVVTQKSYKEKMYLNEDGYIIDIVKQAYEMYERESIWANLSYRVITSDLTEAEIDIISVLTESLIGQFIKHKNK